MKALTPDEFLPEKLFCDSQIGATRVTSSTNETKGSKGENNPTIAQDYQINENVAPYYATIAFTKHLNCILISGGSTVNYAKSYFEKKLGISVDELSKNNLKIQGFDQGGQRSIGKIQVGLPIGDVKSNTLILS